MPTQRIMDDPLFFSRYCICRTFVLSERNGSIFGEGAVADVD